MKSKALSWAEFKSRQINQLGVSENSVPLNPMVLLILIPMKNCYFIGKINPTFSDKPRWEFLNQDSRMPVPCCHLCHVHAPWNPSEVGLLGAAHHVAHAFQGITSTGHNKTRAGRAGRAGVLRYRILDDTGWYWMILDDTGWPDRAHIDSKDDDWIW